MSVVVATLTRAAATAAAIALALGCSAPPPLDPPAVRSCRGEALLECDAYEWAIATAATLEPSEVPITDPRVRPTVTVDLETCGAITPTAPEVHISAVFGSDDAGGPDRVVLLATVRAASADATHIEMTIDNPFTLSVPRNADVMLRFTPVVGGCDGEPIEIPYRTGP